MLNDTNRLSQLAQYLLPCPDRFDDESAATLVSGLLGALMATLGQAITAQQPPERVRTAPTGCSAFFERATDPVR